MTKKKQLRAVSSKKRQLTKQQENEQGLLPRKPMGLFIPYCVFLKINLLSRGRGEKKLHILFKH